MIFQDISGFAKEELRRNTGRIFLDISGYFRKLQDTSGYFGILRDTSGYFRTFQDMRERGTKEEHKDCISGSSLRSLSNHGLLNFLSICRIQRKDYNIITNIILINMNTCKYK